MIGSLRGTLLDRSLTGEILLEKPTVADDRRNVLNYPRDVLPGVVPDWSSHMPMVGPGAWPNTPSGWV